MLVCCLSVVGWCLERLVVTMMDNGLKDDLGKECLEKIVGAFAKI